MDVNQIPLSAASGSDNHVTVWIRTVCLWTVSFYSFIIRISIGFVSSHCLDDYLIQFLNTARS